MAEQDIRAYWQNEPDSKELNEMAEIVKQSYTLAKGNNAAQKINVDEEWQRFCANNNIEEHKTMGWRRWAVAASVCLLCTIGLALGWKNLRHTPATSSAEAVDASTSVTRDSMREDSTKLTFQNASLHTILQELSARHGATVKYLCKEEIYLYVELENAWTLQQCLEFLNHFDRVNLKLTEENVIVAK